jgi:hypothetical protein
MPESNALQQARNAYARALRALVRAEVASARTRDTDHAVRDRDLVRDLLGRLGPLPRDAIATALGLSRPAVDRAVQALVRARRVVVDGHEVRARRPRHANCNEPK